MLKEILVGLCLGAVFAFVSFGSCGAGHSSSLNSGGPVIVTTLRETEQTVADFIEIVGGTEKQARWAIGFWCDPQVAQATNVSITHQSDRFSLLSFPDSITCGPYNPWFPAGSAMVAFSPIEPGVVKDVVTVSTDIGDVSVELIGQGIAVESPEYRIIDLPDGTSAERVFYYGPLRYLFITDSNSDRLLVVSPELGSVVKSIPVGQHPCGMAVSPNGKLLYVANTGELSISEVHLGTLAELRKIPVPSIGPPVGNYMPWEIAMLDDTRALVGTAPPGWASGGPIYEIDFETGTVQSREDIGSGAMPIFSTSRDFSTTAIMLEPQSSPTVVVVYDNRTGSMTKSGIDIDWGVIINGDATAIIVSGGTAFMDRPDLRLMDRELNILNYISLLGLKASQTAFHPNDDFMYALSDPSPDVPFRGVNEVDLASRLQTRTITFSMPDDYCVPDGKWNPKAMAVSDDGVWVFSLLVKTWNEPPSKILMLKVNRPTRLPSDLEVFESALPNPAQLTDTITYTIVARNNGPSDAPGTVLLDALAATVIFESATPPCMMPSGTHIVRCDLGTLHSGASATVEIRVKPTAPGDMINTVVIMGEVFDDNPENNTAVVSTTVEPLVQLTVTKAGTGSGTVTSFPAGINCGDYCTKAFSRGTLVTLTAQADISSVFTGWSGACSGTHPECIITMDDDLSVGATFYSPPQLSSHEGTISSVLTITGSGFSTKKGKVLIGGVSTKIANGDWRIDSIICTLTKVPPEGTHPVIIKPYEMAEISLPNAFTVKSPEITSLDYSHEVPGKPITITGKFFSSKRGKVYLEDPSTLKKKNCKVTHWYMNPANGDSTLTFEVPKLPKGFSTGVAYPLKVTNKVGTIQTTFTVDPTPP